MNKRTKLSLKTRKRKSDKTESDSTEEKLIVVDMSNNDGVPDLIGAAGVSECVGVPTSETSHPPTINNPAFTDLTVTPSNNTTQVMSTNSFVGQEVSTVDPPGVTDSEDIESDNDDEHMDTASNKSTQIKTT